MARKIARGDELRQPQAALEDVPLVPRKCGPDSGYIAAREAQGNPSLASSRGVRLSDIEAHRRVPGASFVSVLVPHTIDAGRWLTDRSALNPPSLRHRATHSSRSCGRTYSMK